MKRYIMIAMVAFLGGCSDDKPQNKIEIAKPKPPIVIEQSPNPKEESKHAPDGVFGHNRVIHNESDLRRK